MEKIDEKNQIPLNPVFQDQGSDFKTTDSKDEPNIATECFSQQGAVFSSVDHSKTAKLVKAVKGKSSRYFPFDSVEVIDKLESSSHAELIRLDKAYGGLCEIICNYVLVNKVLGKSPKKCFLKEAITADKLNEESIRKSHVVEVYLSDENAEAFLSGHYPNNIFSESEQQQLVITKKDKRNQKGRSFVNEKILKTGLERIEVGETIKVEIFAKSHEGFRGHSVLIKKTSRDKYIYFCPTIGEVRNLKLSDLYFPLNRELEGRNCNELLFIKGSDYVKVLEKNGILNAGK